MPVRTNPNTAPRLAAAARRSLAFSTLLALALLLGLGLLGGCPKRSDNGADGGAGAQSNPEAGQGGLKGGLSPTTTTPGGSAEETAAAGTASDGAAGQQAASAPALSELAGRWFALYGREGSGIAYYTYLDAKFVTLDDRGNLLIEDGAAAPNAALRGRYQLVAGELRARFSDPRLGAEQLLAQQPLGQPLPAAPQPGMVLAGNKPVTPETLGLSLDYDRQFLALSDGRGKLTVYGRDDSPSLGGIPNMQGQWQLYIGARGSYVCEMSSDGADVTLLWSNEAGWFKGRFSHGYYIGHGQDVTTVFSGALTLSAEDTLNGFYSPEPYVDALPIFDLKRIAAQ